MQKYLEIVRWNATAIIDDLEPFLAVLFQGDHDAGGTSVQAVLHQLLDGQREVEYHLPRANYVNDALVYGPNGGAREKPWLLVRVLANYLY